MIPLMYERFNDIYCINKVFIQHSCFLMVTSVKSNNSCSFENADERHVGPSDSRTAPRGDSQCRGNEIHAWKTYMEMKGFLSGSKSGEQRSQSFARNTRASGRRSRCTCDLARIPPEPCFLLLLPYYFWFATRMSRCRGTRAAAHITGWTAFFVNELPSSHVESILSLRDLRFRF